MGEVIMYLLDTNILIYHFNDNIPEDQSEKVDNIFKKYFNISIITKMEFLGFRKHTSFTFEKAKDFFAEDFYFGDSGYAGGFYTATKKENIPEVFYEIYPDSR